jgi:hypothetical protein
MEAVTQSLPVQFAYVEWHFDRDGMTAELQYYFRVIGIAELHRLISVVKKVIATVEGNETSYVQAFRMFTHLVFELTAPQAGDNCSPTPSIGSAYWRFFCTADLGLVFRSFLVTAQGLAHHPSFAPWWDIAIYHRKLMTIGVAILAGETMANLMLLRMDAI